jgi:hypothetical protein
MPSPTHLAEVDPSLLDRLARSKLLFSSDILELSFRCFVLLTGVLNSRVSKIPMRVETSTMGFSWYAYRTLRYARRTQSYAYRRLNSRQSRLKPSVFRPPDIFFLGRQIFETNHYKHHTNLSQSICPPTILSESTLFHSILIPKLHILAISEIRKFDIPRMLNNSTISLLVLPAIIHQKRNGRRNSDRIHHDNRELRRKVDGRVFVAESQWAEDVSLSQKSAVILALPQAVARWPSKNAFNSPNRNSSAKSHS